MELVTDDRMGGLEAPDGRRFRPDVRGVLTLPEELAAYGRTAARVCPLFHVHRRGYAGFDAGELRARYERWRAGGSGVAVAGAAPGAEGGERE